MWGLRRRGSRADARAIKTTRECDECGQSVKPPLKSQYYLQDILWCLQGLDKDKTGREGGRWVGGLGEGQGFEVEKGEGENGGGHCHSPTVLSPPRTTATTSVSPTNLPPAYFNNPCNCPFPLPFYLPAPPLLLLLALISSIIFPTYSFSQNDHCKCKRLNQGTVHLKERAQGPCFFGCVNV